MYFTVVLCDRRYEWLTTKLNGNKQTGYKLVSWNCGRGLLLGTEVDSTKFIDIKLFIQKYKPHLFAVIESDLHGPNTAAVNRRTKFTTNEIKEKLFIEGN